MRDESRSGLRETAEQASDSELLILHAYFGLRRTQPAKTIGTDEIQSWIRRHEGTSEAPSDTAVLNVLHHAELPHRGPGRPSRESRGMQAPPPPFFPIRPDAPRTSRRR